MKIGRKMQIFRPMPRLMLARGGVCRLAAPPVMMLAAEAPFAETIRRQLETLLCRVEQSASLPPHALLIAANGAGEALLARLAALEPPANAEGYRLVVDGDGVLLRGADAAGLFYGVQTLRQLLAGNAEEIPCLEIEDWPEMGYRGFAPFFGGHAYDKLPENPRYYRRWAELAAAHKLNRFAFESEAFGDDAELRAFGDFCRAHGLEPIPTHPFLGIMHPHVVRYVEAGEEEFQEIMRPAARAMHLLKPQVFCIGADELITSYDHTKRDSLYTAEQQAKMAPHEWLARCLLRFHHYFAERGVTLAIWADSLIDPEQFYGCPAVNGYGGAPDDYYRMAPLLPRDLQLWDWQYTAVPEYPSLSHLRELGFDTVACPWFRMANLELLAEYGCKTAGKQLLGMMGLHWATPRDEEKLEQLIPRDGDCAWSPGRYGDGHPGLDAYRKIIAQNPCRNLPPGRHHLRFTPDAETENAAFRVYALRIVGGEAIDVKPGRTAETDYGFTTAPGAEFTLFKVVIYLTAACKATIAYASTIDGDNFISLANAGPGGTLAAAVPTPIQGQQICLRLILFNASSERMGMIEEMEIDCKVVE